MYYYKLDNKELDRLFLSDSPVSCRAIVRKEDCNTLKQDSPLVIMLSNGKKYKARIIGFQYEIHNGYADGELEIKRAR